MATMATGAWLAPGNRVEVVQNGAGTFPRLWQAVVAGTDGGAGRELADPSAVTRTLVCRMLRRRAR